MSSVRNGNITAVGKGAVSNMITVTSLVKTNLNSSERRESESTDSLPSEWSSDGRPMEDGTVSSSESTRYDFRPLGSDVKQYEISSHHSQSVGIFQHKYSDR
jgi:hypothetical protein